MERDAWPGRGRLVLGAVGGIPIRVHPTFLVLVALALMGGLGPPLEGLARLTLLFGSVVAHELSHSLVARRKGVVVKDIVLLPIGGVSEMERLPDRPHDELAVAAAGPAASVGIAMAAALLCVAARVDLFPPSLVAGPLLRRLARANVMLAGFNLLPAFPMDGGRVLRAALAQRMGLEAATRRAAAVGRGLAASMAALGVLVSPWLLLIAVFVWFGGRAEETATVAHLRLEGLTAADVMVVSPFTADVDTGGRIVGLVMLDDVARLAAGAPSLLRAG